MSEHAWVVIIHLSGMITTISVYGILYGLRGKPAYSDPIELIFCTIFWPGFIIAGLAIAIFFPVYMGSKLLGSYIREKVGWKEQTGE